MRQGKVLYLGASSMYAWELMKMLSISERNGWAQFVSMQNHYNLVYREEEREMMPLCVEEGLGVIPWSPLARGLLTGKRSRGSHEASSRDEHDAPLADELYDHEADWDVVEATVRVAERRGVEPVQVALAWLMSRPAVVAPVVGFTRVGQMDAVAGAVDVVLSEGRVCGTGGAVPAARGAGMAGRAGAVAGDQLVSGGGAGGAGRAARTWAGIPGVTLTRADFEAAYENVAPHVYRTPLLTNRSLSEACGFDVRLKAELFQRGGSYKVRGPLNKIARLTDEERARGVICSSAGNHAQGVAIAARHYGVRAVVVMAENATPAKIGGNGGLRGASCPARHDLGTRPTRRRSNSSSRRATRISIRSTTPT